MKARSHYSLSILLADHYLCNISGLKRKAFLFGCVQPDRNPLTYLKGSFRGRWLRGHNYENAQRFLIRICRRLERKHKLNLWDYYTVGKLIHYTADAFTYAHNSTFPGGIKQHRKYERTLQACFLQLLRQPPESHFDFFPAIAEMVIRQHADYLEHPRSAETDCVYIYRVCCAVMAQLSKKTSSAIP